MRRVLFGVLIACAAALVAPAALASTPPNNERPAPAAPVPQEPAAPARAAAAVAPARKMVVVEYVLYAGSADADGRQGLFSDGELEVVKIHKAMAVRDAFAAGKARPVLSMTERTCTYPLDVRGNPRAEGSTCVEKEVT